LNGKIPYVIPTPHGYNAAWDAFIRAYPDATYMEAMNFMNALKNAMGFGLGY
jgi:hypothetical protein